MYVCMCHGVTDRQIKQAVADGHRDFLSIQAELGAGTGCGGCRDFTADLIDDLTQKSLSARAGELSHAA
ncbi:MAG: (2Fe-2S)-binding protein [Pseudomonadales bacterium]|nr:(2Fe-2S)-binding protein [Pseudomonadales bacterium]